MKKKARTKKPHLKNNGKTTGDVANTLHSKNRENFCSVTNKSLHLQLFSGRNLGMLVKAYRYLSLKIANLNNADRPINARLLYIIYRYIAKRGFGLYLHGVLAMPQTCRPIKLTLFAFSYSLFEFLGHKTNVQNEKFFIFIGYVANVCIHVMF